MATHKWKFKAHFRNGAYGWKGTSLASKRMKEAVSEIKKVARTDSALAGEAGIPSVLFGPIGHGAHAVDEWVSLKSLLKVYETLKRLVMDF